jgi:hypothetical protein
MTSQGWVLLLKVSATKWALFKKALRRGTRDRRKGTNGVYSCLSTFAFRASVITWLLTTAVTTLTWLRARTRPLDAWLNHSSWCESDDYRNKTFKLFHILWRQPHLVVGSMTLWEPRASNITFAPSDTLRSLLTWKQSCRAKNCQVSFGAADLIVRYLFWGNRRRIYVTGTSLRFAHKECWLPKKKISKRVLYLFGLSYVGL